MSGLGSVQFYIYPGKLYLIILFCKFIGHYLITIVVQLDKYVSQFVFQTKFCARIHWAFLRLCSFLKNAKARVGKRFKGNLVIVEDLHFFKAYITWNLLSVRWENTTTSLVCFFMGMLRVYLNMLDFANSYLNSWRTS